MERLMGLDIGDKTIGVAISDPLFITAQGLKTIKRDNLKKDIELLANIVEEYNISKIIIGLPKNMNNSLGPQGEKVTKIGEIIADKLKKEVVYIDERLSTVSAEKMLIQGDVRRDKRRKVIDMVAATYILQTYLDRR